MIHINNVVDEGNSRQLIVDALLTQGSMDLNFQTQVTH
jgi:hypothetical protein